MCWADLSFVPGELSRLWSSYLLIEVFVPSEASATIGVNSFMASIYLVPDLTSIDSCLLSSLLIVTSWTMESRPSLS